MSNYRYFLRVDGLRGVSKTKGHFGDIDVLSFSFSGIQHSTGGGTTGMMRPSGEGVRTAGQWTIAPGAMMGNLTVVKYLDNASPKLSDWATGGDMIDTVILLAEKILPHGAGMPAATWMLNNAYVSGLSPGGMAHGSLMPMESVSFTPEEYMYKPG